MNTTRRHKVRFVTIVPSPYQRDLFGALAARRDIDLKVYYMEAASPDSPWPTKSLRNYERIMPGFWLPLGSVRMHVNWSLPDLSDADFVILSSFTSVTGQFLMRTALREKRWIFWGERLQQNSGLKDIIQGRLAAPIQQASAIVGIGRAAQDAYQRRFPHVPHFNIPYHCDLEPFFAVHRSSEANTPVRFLFCGQMIERKGIDLLLQAFDHLVADGIDARLVLVGRQATLPKYLNMMSASARNKVFYEGFQAPERLAEFFERSDVFVLPSRHDGWGVVVNQALAAGLPVITSHAVGAGMDLVCDGVNGLRVATGDVDDLYRAMKLLARQPGLARQLGEASRHKAHDLTPECGAEKWGRLFDRLSRYVPADPSSIIEFK